MLSVCLHARDAAGAWAPAAGGWTAGRSTILPFGHPALHSCLLASPGRTAVLVRERDAGEPCDGDDSAIVRCGERELDRQLAALRSWPLDFLELLIDRRDGGARVRLRSGRWGTAPVFLGARGGLLRVDWDVLRLYPHLESARLDPAMAARYLCDLFHPYARRTIFPDVAMLTERATAAWSPSSQVRITYPRPEVRAGAARLRPRARVAETFREILGASMRRWLSATDGPAAVELSGGLDSSIVAAVAAGTAVGPVRSYGLIMPGALGGHQRMRRREVVRRFGLIDRARPCLADPPFGPRGCRTREVAAVPWGEFYEEAAGAMLERAAADGVRLIFSGLGGDELCARQPGEVEEDFAGDGAEAGASPYPPFATRLLEEAYESGDALRDPAPRALLETSALESVAAVAPIALRRGIWPVNPLCTPELVEFCRRLPFAWRRRRKVEREVLASLGCSRAVTHARPERLETFEPVMEHALRRASAGVIAALFRDSRLAEQGLVDRDHLVATYAQYRRGDLRHGTQILAAAVLELTIRAIEARR